ncbi:putative CXXCH cytochrome family protein [Granulicella aggregans]|uniref:Putative CXXCH cytochrome family protein n=1 Tax=Granulicella aggregans TaxID=474949 RepID=A0A7W7ZDS2_9BACT|nr:multiheme c-type cytochrome [Granulicella aggregans]MBB5057734.1 putative CXXCH cytochrome family protein [Granulicella aggregans]
MSSRPTSTKSLAARIIATVAFLLLCLTSKPLLADTAKAHFTGSEACKSCHLKAYEGWKKTRMANVIRDPKVHSEAVLGDFTHADPIRTFPLDEVAFVYGSRFKQRYFTKRGNDYFPEPAQWDVKGQRWLPYHAEAGTDWWLPFYGPSNFDRPTGPTCDGCHSVNYDLQTHQVTEWNVGCEKCHGPGSLHVARPTKANIVNPETLDYVRGNDTCIQCHSQGRPLTEPTKDNAYDWPVGYLPGDRLADFWKLEELKPGTTNFFQFADLTGHKNRMQGNDFVQSNMYHRQLRCFDCHQVHSDTVSNLPVSGNALCLGCHNKENPAGLKGTVEEHTHHAANSPGSQCTACHMPRIEQTIKGNAVAAHTFRFITPTAMEQSGIPSACTSCHTGKSNAWATKALVSWSTASPWRVAQ